MTKTLITRRSSVSFKETFLYVPKSIKRDLRVQVIKNTLALINESVEHYHFKQSLYKVFDKMFDFIYSKVTKPEESNPDIEKIMKNLSHNNTLIITKKIGSNFQFVIPANTTRELGVEIGDYVDVHLSENCLIIKKSNDLPK